MTGFSQTFAASQQETNPTNPGAPNRGSMMNPMSMMGMLGCSTIQGMGGSGSGYFRNYEKHATTMDDRKIMLMQP